VLIALLQNSDTIRDSVVWWETGSQPVQLLADSLKFLMTMGWNGHLSLPLLVKVNVAVMWDGQEL
jgi:putative spermidine/putrescine transport system substrate-binding protein